MIRARYAQQVTVQGWKELAFASIETLRGLLDRREISALELARATCDHLDDTGRRYNSVVEVTRELAEEQARAADVQLRNGNTGRLVGIPYGAKDMLAT